MIETGATLRRRRFWKYLLILALVGVLSLAGLMWYATTDSFQAMVRRRLINELEGITGGRVELRSIHTIPFHFQVEVRDLTIHGREAAGEIPYAHVDSLVAKFKLISTLGAEFGFRSILLDHPVVHILFYPDGSTNQPKPRLRRIAQQTPSQQLFSLSISRLDVRQGELLWEDQKIPLGFVANDISADMSYSLLHAHYVCNLAWGKVDTHFGNYRPLAWKAEAHFNLSDHGIEVKAFELVSGRSRVEASGSLENFQNVKLSGRYGADLDLAELCAIARCSEIRRGMMQASGTGSWSAQNFKSTGKVRVKDFDWHDALIHSRITDVNAQFAVTPQQVSLSRIDGNFLGGSVTGDASIENWIAPTLLAKSRKGKKGEGQNGLVRLRLKDVSVAEIFSAVSNAKHPWDGMKLAGLADGAIESRWEGSVRSANMQIELEVVPPLHVVPGQLPLQVVAHATYHVASQEIEVRDFSANTHATQVRASGTLGSQAPLHLSVSTTDLAELQQVLSGHGNSLRIPAKLHGPASFDGTLEGQSSDLTLAGNVQARSFESLVPAHSAMPGVQLHWDSLSAQIQLSGHGLVVRSGTLRRDKETVNFDLNAGLDQWNFAEGSPFSANLASHGGDIGEIGLLGYDYPVSGDMDLSLHAGGSRADPHAEGTVQLTNAAIGGYEVDRFHSQFTLRHGQIELNDISLTRDDAHIAGAGSYSPASRSFRFDLKGSNFQLARVPQLQGSRVNVEGRMDFRAQSSGTLDAPQVDAEVELRDLSLGHELVGDFVLNGVTEGNLLHLTGRSHFKDSELSMEGKTLLAGDWPSTFDLHFNHLDVDYLVEAYLKGSVTGHSAVAGDLHVQGPLRRPRELEAVGNLSDLFADIKNVKVRNDGPVRFAISEQYFRLEQFHFIGENTDLSGKGSVQLSGEQQLDLQAQGSVNLQLIESLNPDFTSSGKLTIDAKISGTVSRPTTQGRLQIVDASIADINLPSALSDINGTLIFNQNRVQIETLTAHTGGGLVTFRGDATAYNHQVNFNLSLQGHEVRLRYPPGVSSTADADLHWLGSSSASTFTGDITINKLAITPGFDFGAYLERTAQTNSLPQTNPLLNRIRLDVHVVTTPELQMQTAVVRLSGDADLRVRGTAAKAVLIGRADVIEGEAYFNGTKYHVERGDVTFTNPVATTPVVDLQASTHVRDYDITLNLNGKADTLSLTYRSEPPLPTADIVALLAFGQTTQASAQVKGGQSGYSQDTSNAMLSAALNATVSNRAQRIFGVSHIRFDPQGLATATSPITNSPAVTIEEQVKDNLTLTYSTDISQTSQQIIQGVYNVSSNFSIVGLRDQNGVVSFYVRIRKRKN
jgi:translocation and assembly module TamB